MTEISEKMFTRNSKSIKNMMEELEKMQFIALVIGAPKGCCSVPADSRNNICNPCPKKALKRVDTKCLWVKNWQSGWDSITRTSYVHVTFIMHTNISGYTYSSWMARLYAGLTGGKPGFSRVWCPSLCCLPM